MCGKGNVVIAVAALLDTQKSFMDTKIRIMVIELSAIGRLGFIRLLTNPRFQIPICVAHAREALRLLSLDTTAVPDVCLLSAATHFYTIEWLRKFYPSMKLVAYDPILEGRGYVLSRDIFDGFLDMAGSQEAWIATVLACAERDSSSIEAGK